MTFSRITCPLCSQSFAQELRFLRHMTSTHPGIDPLTLFLDVHHDGVHPTCSCSPQCDVPLSWSGWKKGFVSRYARGHNARVDSVYLDPLRQAEFAAARQGKTSWNAGLTAESDPRVAAAAKKISASLKAGYASGDIVDWRTADPEAARRVADKISNTKRAAYARGDIAPWNSGLTKETSPAVARAAAKISERYETREAGRRIKVDDLERRLDKFAKSFQLVSSLDDYSTRRAKRLEFRCMTCGTLQVKSLAMLEETPICFTCNPKESQGRLEVYDFVASLAPGALLSDRTLIAPLEIDVLVPSARLAVEYNGLYWHSSSVISSKRYHESKRRAVVAAGHRFLMIFEDEWRDKRQILEGMLRHRLRRPVEVLDARKMSVEKIDLRVAATFFESTHLEGSVSSTAAFGLVDGTGRLVAAMSLRRPFHATHASACLEVARSACLPGVSVRGWMGRLTRAASKHATGMGHTSLLTYVDSRVGDGSSYLTAGWKMEKTPGSPRFWWTDFHRRYNRFRYRADAARDMTQAQVAASAGVTEIYGCGNYVMRYVI